MARTLVGGINATQENVTLSAALTASPGDLFKIDNEVVQFGGYGRIGRLKDFTHKRVIFHRGVGETTAATHANGASVLGVADGLVASTSESLPSPFSSAGQASNANLTAFSGLTLVSDRLPYANGSGTLALATFTAAGRALVDDASAAAQLTTLGVIRGRVAADGTVAGGSGFTSAKDATGEYTVTFTSAFAAIPAVIAGTGATDNSTQNRYATAHTLAVGSVKVVTYSDPNGGTKADLPFSFIAMAV